MLSPEYLESLPNSVLELYQDAEIEIIKDISRRISKEGYLTPTGLWQTQKLQEIQLIESDILKRLSEVTGKAEEQIAEDYYNAMQVNLAYEDAIHEEAGKILIPLKDNQALIQIITAGLAKTEGLFLNLTATTPNTGGRQLELLLDRAYNEVMSGAFTYDQAIKKAIKTYSATGIKSVTYTSGHTDYIDTVVRRSLLTGVNQTAGEINIARADEAGSDLVEVSAHGGARTGSGVADHADWQGKIYSRSGENSKYQDFIRYTGYGSGDGLCGWNCRHNFSTYYEGISKPAYTGKMRKDYNAKDITYNDAKITQYEASQIQRYQERQIKSWKRQAIGLEVNDPKSNEYFKAKAKVGEWQAAQRDFVKQTGLKRDYTRERA